MKPHWFNRKDELIDAVFNDDVVTAEKLLRRRYQCNMMQRLAGLILKPRPDNRYLLHVAAYANSPGVSCLLIKNGADVNSVDAVGNTPLHVAARYNSWEVADILLSSGAGLHLRNEQEQTAVDVAVECGNQKLVELLTLVAEKHGAAE